VLSGEDVASAEAGNVIVVPRRLPHAFAELLIISAPGAERCEYFGQPTRIARGDEAPETLRDIQDLYDIYF
jgi:hypothetical protein